MPHYPKPFFRGPRRLWYVEVDGRQVKLGPHRDEAFRRYYDLMARGRDLGDQRLFRVDRQQRHPHLGPLLNGRINRDRILRHWDDLLRVAGSLKRGWVTSSLLIGKLQSYPRKNRLTRALQEYGRLIKTIFILRYLDSEDYRRRIQAQLNKGEASTACGSSSCSRTRASFGRSRMRADEPGGLPEPRNQRGGDLEHSLHGGGDQPSPGRGQDGERGEYRPALPGPLRTHQPVRQVPLRGRG